MTRKVPQLMGTTEAADALDVSRQRVIQYVQDGRLKPVQILGMGPVFLADDVRNLALIPRVTGRPKKVKE
jgi:predicted site-specific integrase-resolvase